MSDDPQKDLARFHNNASRSPQQTYSSHLTLKAHSQSCRFLRPLSPSSSTIMTELEDIKQQIAYTEAKLKLAEEDAEKSLDFSRRDRLEGLLLEQQRTLNLLLARLGN